MKNIKKFDNKKQDIDFNNIFEMVEKKSKNIKY